MAGNYPMAPHLNGENRFIKTSFSSREYPYHHPEPPPPKPNISLYDSSYDKQDFRWGNSNPFSPIDSRDRRIAVVNSPNMLDTDRRIAVQASDRDMREKFSPFHERTRASSSSTDESTGRPPRLGGFPKDPGPNNFERRMNTDIRVDTDRRFGSEGRFDYDRRREPGQRFDPETRFSSERQMSAERLIDRSSDGRYNNSNYGGPNKSQVSPFIPNSNPKFVNRESSLTKPDPKRFESDANQNENYSKLNERQENRFESYSKRRENDSKQIKNESNRYDNDSKWQDKNEPNRHKNESNRYDNDSKRNENVSKWRENDAKIEKEQFEHKKKELQRMRRLHRKKKKLEESLKRSDLDSKATSDQSSGTDLEDEPSDDSSSQKKTDKNSERKRKSSRSSSGGARKRSHSRSDSKNTRKSKHSESPSKSSRKSPASSKSPKSETRSSRGHKYSSKDLKRVKNSCVNSADSPDTTIEEGELKSSASSQSDDYEVRKTKSDISHGSNKHMSASDLKLMEDLKQKNTAFQKQVKHLNSELINQRKTLERFTKDHDIKVENLEEFYHDELETLRKEISYLKKENTHERESTDLARAKERDLLAKVRRLEDSLLHSGKEHLDLSETVKRLTEENASLRYGSFARIYHPPPLPSPLPPTDYSYQPPPW